MINMEVLKNIGDEITNLNVKLFMYRDNRNRNKEDSKIEGALEETQLKLKDLMLYLNNITQNKQEKPLSVLSKEEYNKIRKEINILKKIL